MNTETFFTLGEYKQNYDKLRIEFVEAYEDNDEEEFISLQLEWYQKCSLNTELEWTVFDGDIGWFPKVFFNDNVLIWEVIEKFRNEKGGMNPTVAQNLSVSFGKILKFLNQRLIKPESKFTAARAMLYHFVLQEAKLEPPFPDGSKGKALESLSIRYRISKDNLKNKYNDIMPSDGKRGYNKEDAKVVRDLIIANNPTALPTFENITKHLLI